jgi:hypothetical protein
MHNLKRYALIVLSILALALLLPTSLYAASGPTWTVNSLDSIGCNSGDISFTTTLSGYTGGPERFHTVVEAGGLIYMNEDAGTPGGGDGTYGWHLYNSSSGGPTTATFPLPPDTLITVHFELINGVGGPAVSEDVFYLSKCNKSTIITSSLPGPDMVDIPSTAVVGAFVVTTPIYFAPQADAATTTVMEAGKTLWVYGVDASGKFYKVMMSGKFFWVPVSTMGPNYDAVWQGHPLPTDVVS